MILLSSHVYSRCGTSSSITTTSPLVAALRRSVATTTTSPRAAVSTCVGDNVRDIVPSGSLNHFPPPPTRAISSRLFINTSAVRKSSFLSTTTTVSSPVVGLQRRSPALKVSTTTPLVDRFGLRHLSVSSVASPQTDIILECEANDQIDDNKMVWNVQPIPLKLRTPVPS